MVQVTGIAVHTMTEIFIIQDPYIEYPYQQYMCQGIAHHQDITVEDVGEDGKFGGLQKSSFKKTTSVFITLNPKIFSAQSF
jgi:hypothetical protein